MGKIIIAKRFSEEQKGLVMFSSFVAVFGTTWLFVEPLGLFSVGSDFFKNLGLKGYICLIIISLVISALIEVVTIYFRLKKLDLISLSIILHTTGKKYEVQVPRHLLVNDLLVYFFDYLKIKEKITDVDTLNKYYNAHLSINIGDNKFVKVDNWKSIVDAGIVNNQECKIEGKPKKISNVFYAFGIFAEINRKLADLFLRLINIY